MTERYKIKVLVVDDDTDFQYLLKRTIDREPDMELAGAASTPDESLALALRCRPDIILMDLALCGRTSDGIEAARRIRLLTDSKVLILTAFESPELVVEAAVRGFAHGYLYKSQFELLTATIRKAFAGAMPQEHMIRALILSRLSPAEYSIFRLMLGEEVSLHSSPKTIANQKTMVLRKLGLNTQGELVHLFGQRRSPEPQDPSSRSGEMR